MRDHGRVEKRSPADGDAALCRSILEHKAQPGVRLRSRQVPPPFVREELFYSRLCSALRPHATGRRRSPGSARFMQGREQGSTGCEAKERLEDVDVSI